MKGLFTSAALLLVLVRADVTLAQTAPQKQVDAALARAKAAGIPAALLESKIAEGRAKGVPMDRIAAAIERREAALERASEALKGRPDVSSGDLSVAADAVESGVSAAVLKAIAGSAPRERRTVAIAALTELVKQGRTPEAALERVKDALKRGPDALANLPAQAAAGDHGRPDGQLPDAAGGRGGAQGPPASVPAPGQATQPTKPVGGKPADPGKATTPPATQPTAGRGRSGGQ
jgi:hypothetical protein